MMRSWWCTTLKTVTPHVDPERRHHTCSLCNTQTAISGCGFGQGPIAAHIDFGPLAQTLKTRNRRS